MSFQMIYINCAVSLSNLTAGDGEEALHHIVNIIVLQVRVISDWWIIT